MNTMTPVSPKVMEDKVISGTPRTMNFIDAMKRIQAGEKVSRVSWGNTDYCLMKDGWLTVYRKNEFHTWLINDGDMDGQDWIIVIV